MKRIITMLTLAAFLVAALTITAAGAFAAPQPCTAGEPGCNENKQVEPVSPSEGAGQPEPFTQTTTTSGKGNSANTAGEKNPHTEIVEGPVTNRGGGTPGGQQ
jgi:hypothetical protein